MSILYMEIGGTIFSLQKGYTLKEIQMGCPDHPDTRGCPSHNWVNIPIALSILGIMFYFMYIFVTDILLSRKQRIENQ